VIAVAAVVHPDTNATDWAGGGWAGWDQRGGWFRVWPFKGGVAALAGGNRDRPKTNATDWAIGGCNRVV
jgi:hypothetical protein